MSAPQHVTDVEPTMRTGRLMGLYSSNGGVPKLPIERVLVTTAGLSGDWQTDRRYHGGPERAVCLYARELIDALREEGHPIAPGDIGENIVVEGIDWRLVKPGSVMTLGAQLEIQVTSYTAPCRTIRHAFKDKRFVRISQKANPGWSRLYARVLMPGEIALGDVVDLAPDVR